jgi:PAS domain S-box-containing protein
LNFQQGFDFSSSKRVLLGSFILSLCYYLSAKVGLVLSVKPDYISVLWIPNAFLLTALLVTPYRYWIFFLIAIIPAELAADLPEGVSLMMSAGFIVADWIEVLIAASLVKKLTKDEFKFHKLNHLIIFICAAVLMGPFYAAFPGALINWIFSPPGPSFWSRWITWFMGDALTHLTITLPLYVWLKYRYLGLRYRKPVIFYLELFSLIALIILSVHLAMVSETGTILPGPARYLLPMPFLLWAAVRFGPRTIFTASFFITIIYVWNTSHGYGMFPGATPSEEVFNLQCYLIISLTPFMFLSILMEEQKFNRDQIRHNENQFRELADFLPQAIFEIDLEGKFTFVNQSALEQFKYTVEDFESGRFTALDMIDPQDQDRAAGDILRVMEGEDVGLKEYMALRKDNTTFPCLIRSSQIIREGEKAGLRGFLIDISELKNMEEYIRESEARYDQIVQFSPVGIFEVDLEKRKFISVNDVVCDYTGYNEAQLLAMDPSDLLTAASQETVEKLYESIYAGKPSAGPVEYTIQGRNNQKFQVLVNYRFLYENGQPKKASALVNDITAIRKAEDEKKVLEAQLVQAQKMESLGTLAGGIAHDFNNLLTGIHGNISLIKLDTDPDFKHYDRLNSVETYVQRAVDLTKQLLGLAKGGKYEVRPININHLLTASSEMFERTRKEITVHREFEKKVWTVEVDHNQIEMVLLNLYVNAWHAMGGSGDLFLKTENMILSDQYAEKFDVKSGKYIKISVRDTGMGIDPMTQKRIFDPFFTTKEKERGTGLGLASAYGIIKNHDGIINVDSEPGKGATFNIFLPASEKMPEQNKFVKKRIQTGKETILMIDDEKMIIGVGREMLTSMGYQVITADNGVNALEIVSARKTEIDLVILDMIMPKLSGRQTFEQLKAIAPDMKVILSSGYSIDGDASEIMAKGCNGFIQKPFSMETLSNKIREVLDG